MKATVNPAIWLFSAIDLLAIILLPAQAESEPAGTRNSARVLVVENSKSGASKTVAEYYGAKRGIKNVIRISCPDAALSIENETIEFWQYLNRIERPIRSYLKSHPKIDFIVLTKGVPIRISRPRIAGNRLDFYSVDGRLAALGYGGLPDAHRVDIRDTHYDESYIMQYHHNFQGKAWANKFWNSTARFSHARFGGYLVTRLDGYSVSDAEALVDRGLQAEQLIAKGGHPDGPILLNPALKFGFADKASQPYSIVPLDVKNGAEIQITSEDARLGDFNSDMEHAAEQLGAQGLQVELEKTGAFIGNRFSLMGYFSWGSNDPNFKSELYRSLEFSPGAIAETAVSTSARTFFHSNLGQSLVADLVAQGVTGVKGYTDEPLIQAVAQPSILMDRYTRGWTLAESFYAASHLVGWQDIVIGDPLARAYPEKP